MIFSRKKEFWRICLCSNLQKGNDQTIKNILIHFHFRYLRIDPRNTNANIKAKDKENENKFDNLIEDQNKVEEIKKTNRFAIVKYDPKFSTGGFF